MLEATVGSCVLEGTYSIESLKIATCALFNMYMQAIQKCYCICACMPILKGFVSSPDGVPFDISGQRWANAPFDCIAAQVAL